MILLGVDPGLTTTGYGIIEFTNGRYSFIEAGIIRTKIKEGLAIKLKQIYDELESILIRCKVHYLIIEDLYSKYASPKTAILMGHARGVICLAAARHGIPVIGYTATKVRSALTGNGRAKKSQIQRVLQKLLGLDLLPRPSDVADALALALTHVNILGKIY